MEDGQPPRTEDVISKHFAHLQISRYHELHRRAIELYFRVLTVSFLKAEIIVQPQKYYTAIVAVAEVREQIILWLEKPIVLTFKKAQYGFDAQLTCSSVLCMENNLLPIFESSESELGVRIAQLQFKIIVY